MKVDSDDNKIVKICTFITFLMIISSIFVHSFSSRKYKALPTFCII